MWKANWGERHEDGTRKWGEKDRATAVRNYEDATFILQHWHDLGDGDSLCDRFDPETRLCMAHDERPPICQDFPYYGENTAQKVIDSLGEGDLRCSFWADVPKEQWPKGVRPLKVPVKIGARR